MLIGFSAIALLVGFAYFVFWIFIAADILRRPADQWKAVGHTQIVWLLAVGIFHVIGPVLYLAIVRPQLQRVEDAARAGNDPGSIIR